MNESSSSDGRDPLASLPSPSGAAPPEAFWPLVNQLADDCDRLEAGAHLSQGQARAYVMAVCLQLEAGTFGLKTLVLRAARSPVSSDGISVVMGRRYRLDSDGRLVQEDSRHDPVAEIQYAFALFSEWLYRMAWAPNYEGPGWKAVGTTFRVRDRIAHPGSLSDIEIGSLELEQAKKAFRWFIRNVNLGLLQCIKKMHEDIGAPLDPAWPEWHRTLLAEMEAEGI